jgi:hypothetical protein
MKKWILPVVLLTAIGAQAQMTVSLQLPPSGLAIKSQLWNMLITNSTTAAKTVRVELKLTQAQTGTPVLNATTPFIVVPPGGQLLQEASFTPIQYNITDPALNGFAATSFLPPGQFIACYDLTGFEGQIIAEECQAIEVEPLAPPQLVYPYDGTGVETVTPVFNWLPPMPANLFVNLTYDFQLVEMLPLQTPVDAIEQNVPLCNQSYVSTSGLSYPAGAPPLVWDKKYAWRVSARNGTSVVANTETWWFSPQQFIKRDSVALNEAPFVKLAKDGNTAYAVFINTIKFEYRNETADTAWTYTLSDITAAAPVALALPLNSIPLRGGENLVEISGSQADLINKHLYLLQLKNSRGETWQLKFEYRKEQN